MKNVKIDESGSSNLDFIKSKMISTPDSSNHISAVENIQNTR